MTTTQVLIKKVMLVMGTGTWGMRDMQSCSHGDRHLSTGACLYLLS